MTRLLLAGTGLIGARHLAHILADPELTLAGVIDPAPGIPVAAPLWDRIEDVDVAADGIVIATPTETHAPLAVAAAARGWHALVEKPVAHDLAAADVIAEAAARHGTRVLVGHHRRHHPRVAAAKALLDDGAIGRVVAASLMWCVRKPDAYFDTPWRAGPEGGPIRLNLIHEIDLMRHLLGEVVRVSAHATAPVRGVAARPEAGGVLLGFASGATAAIAFADTAPSPWSFEAATAENPNIAATHRDNLRLVGTEGALSFPSLTLWRGAADWSEAPVAERAACPAGPVPLAAQLHHFAQVIAGDATPLCTLADGRAALDVVGRIEACLPAHEVAA